MAQLPEFLEVATLFEEVAETITAHLVARSRVLFPYTRAARRSGAAGQPLATGPADADAPSGGRLDHGTIGARCAGSVSSEWLCATGGACLTYASCLRELEDFERDLHLHLDLEDHRCSKDARPAGASPAAVGAEISMTESDLSGGRLRSARWPLSGVRNPVSWRLLPPSLYVPRARSGHAMTLISTNELDVGQWSSSPCSSW